MATTSSTNPVTAVPAADPGVAEVHLAALPTSGTDCWDVHEALGTSPTAVGGRA